MDPLTMMLIAGGMSALLSGGGSALNFGLNKSQMKRQVQYQRELMDHQYNLQSKMIQNYHSWNVSSLRNAGLNPVLSANHGGSSGGSFGATVTSPQADFDFGNVASTAIQAASLKSNLEKQKAEADIAKQQALNNWDMQYEDLKNKQYQGDLLRAQTDYYKQQTLGQKLANKSNEFSADFDSSAYGKFIHGADKTLDIFRGIIPATSGKYGRAHNTNSNNK